MFVHDTHTMQQRGNEEKKAYWRQTSHDICIISWNAYSVYITHTKIVGFRLICVFFIQSKYFTLRCQKGNQQLEIDHFGFGSLSTKSIEKWARSVPLNFWCLCLDTLNHGKWQIILMKKKVQFRFEFVSLFLRTQAENHRKRWTVCDV